MNGKNTGVNRNFPFSTCLFEDLHPEYAVIFS